MTASDTLEMCIHCHEATGRAGAGDDSLYTGTVGPFCEECYKETEHAELHARIASLEADPDAMRRLLEYHRRFHGKAGCPGDSCYVCKAEDEYEEVASDQAERAKSVLDRLPRTTDGVPVIPHIDTVFCLRRDATLGGENGLTVVARPVVDIYEAFVTVDPVEDECFTVAANDPWIWRDCYSTREAAEAARDTDRGAQA